MLRQLREPLRGREGRRAQNRPLLGYLLLILALGLIQPAYAKERYFFTKNKFFISSVQAVPVSLSFWLPFVPNRLTDAMLLVFNQTAILSGKTVRCVDYQIFRYGNSRLDSGDGFARVNPTFFEISASQYFAANFTPGTSRLSSSVELEGVNVFLWDYLSELGNFTVTYELFKLPLSMANANTTAISQYLFNLGYDCIISPTIMSPDKYPYMNFLTPHQPFGMIVVGRAPIAGGTTVTRVLSSWADPFDRQVWAVVAALLSFSSMAMLFFEGHAQNHGDFGPEYLHWTRRLGRGFYKCMMSYTMTGSFEPMTPAGRFYSVVFSFVVLLVQSAYTANLAAFFTRTNVTTQLIQNMDTFASFNYVVCVQSGTEDVDWLMSRYPSVKMVQVNATATAGVLDALNRGFGNCQGAVVSDMEAYYALNVADTNNTYCTLTTIGNAMGHFYYAIPLNRNSSVLGANEISALNSLIVEAISYGDYELNANEVNFPQSRSAPCQVILSAAASSSDGSVRLWTGAFEIPSLSFQQMAGVFFIQACGLCVALVIHFLFSRRGLKGWFLRRAARKQSDGEKDEESYGEEGDGQTEGVRLKKNMKEIPLNAMMNIEGAMQRAMQQLQMIQEQQRAIDLLYTMQEQHHAPNHSANVPLHVMAKMDRAVGFGLHAKSSLLLLDGRNQVMAKLSYVLNESAELSQAFLKMSEEDAAEFDVRVTEFLRAKTEEMRRRRAGNVRDGAPDAARTSCSLSIQCHRQPVRGCTCGSRLLLPAPQLTHPDSSPCPAQQQRNGPMLLQRGGSGPPPPPSAGSDYNGPSGYNGQNGGGNGHSYGNGGGGGAVVRAQTNASGHSGGGAGRPLMGLGRAQTAIPRTRVNS